MSFLFTNTITISDGGTNTTNYAGNLDNDVFLNSSIISFK